MTFLRTLTVAIFTAALEMIAMILAISALIGLGIFSQIEEVAEWFKKKNE